MNKNAAATHFDTYTSVAVALRERQQIKLLLEREQTGSCEPQRNEREINLSHLTWDNWSSQVGFTRSAKTICNKIWRLSDGRKTV